MVKPLSRPTASSSLVLTADVCRKVDKVLPSDIRSFTSCTVLDTCPNARSERCTAHHIFISGVLAQNVELVLSSSSFDQRLFCLPVFRLSPSVTTQVTLLNNFCQFIVNDTASLIART